MIGSIIGAFAQSDAAKKAAAAQADALAQQRARLDGITVPEAKKLILKELVSQGQLTPQLQEAFNLPPSEVAKIQEDNGIRAQQVKALDLISQRAAGGLSASDRANYNELRNATQRDQQAKQAQILQSMQARGMGGSGAELAMQLAQAQNSSQSASEEGDRIAAAASQNAINAANQMAQQAGSLRSQDFNVANTKASAADEYNRFNTTNQQNVSNANVGATNQARQFNLTNDQRISDTNTGNYNSEENRYQNALQDQFKNQWMKATGQNAITSAEGQNAANAATAQGMAVAGAGKAFDDTAMKAGSMIAMSDERCKKNVKRFDSEKFLDKLFGASYKYKDEKHGKGDQAGVMAQALERSEEGGRLVHNTPEGKMVDYSKAGGLIMASLADINQRLKSIEKPQSPATNSNGEGQQ